MPYLFGLGEEAAASDVPLMRPMVLEFPDDPAAYLDRQYMLGPDLLVAPVFRADGRVSFYLPAGEWTHLLTGVRVVGGRWIEEQHDVFSLPLYVRPGAVLPWGAREDRPDYDYLDGLTGGSTRVGAVPSSVGSRRPTVAPPPSPSIARE
ncbi:alpha-D-xyloside xylohydrolase [Microbacterium aurantiacum]|uniref:alpha-D-xyloside xylohydrolase n=1 Tax=Microbacterium aurantiacum TaxID=162393 RepID=UPI003F49AC4F